MCMCVNVCKSKRKGTRIERGQENFEDIQVGFSLKEITVFELKKLVLNLFIFIVFFSNES